MFVGRVVEERAERGAGERGGRVRHRLHEGFRLELGGEAATDCVENLRLRARLLLAREQPREGVLRAPALGDVEHEAEQMARPAGLVVRDADAVVQPDDVAGQRQRPILELVVAAAAVGERLPLRGHAPAVIRMHGGDPELRVGEPALDGIAEDALGLLAHEGELQRVDVGLPEDGSDALDDVAIALLGAPDRAGDEDLLRPLALRDVERDALQEERPAALVLDQPRLAAHPHDPAVAGEEAALGAERAAGATAARELRDPERAVVGMKLAIPEEGILEPLLLAEAEQRLNVRADVDLVLALAQHRHERHGGDLLDQSSVA